jgi:arginase family enzyme
MTLPLSPIDELALLLRPAGAGLHLVSTGAEAQRVLQLRLYNASSSEEVTECFVAQFSRLAKARACILAVPSDVGAGFRRGANLAPQAIRESLLQQHPDWRERCDCAGIVDLGDVFVVPQLLSDDMLNEEQKFASQNEVYASVPPDVRRTLPVSPLSILERALDLVFQLNPTIVPLVLGGDHSVAWPVIAALHRSYAGRGEEPRLGIVQPDAHTDLLASRLGIKICFATWSYHANELLGRNRRLIQLGTRASRMPKQHWESTLDVQQYWADECLARPDAVIDELIANLDSRGIDRVYFSNDIDGTDALYARATGTPEANGLTPDFVREVIRRLGTRIAAADVVEVAPPLCDDPTPTVDLAADYFARSASAALDLNWFGESSPRQAP